MQSPPSDLLFGDSLPRVFEKSSEKIHGVKSFREKRAIPATCKNSKISLDKSESRGRIEP
jgi:hypothetical protein